MKVRITRERPGRKMEDIESLELYDNQGTYMGRIGLNSDADVYQVVVYTLQGRLAVDVNHPATEGKWSKHQGEPPTEE